MTSASVLKLCIGDLLNKQKKTGKDFFDRLLQPLRAKASNKIKIAAFDVETEAQQADFHRKSGDCVSAKKQTFVMGSVVGDRVSEVFWDRNEMAEFLLSEKLRDHYIYAHNLEFDFNILYHDQLARFQVPIFRNKLLGITHKRKINKKMASWRFIDSMNYMPMALAKIGDIVGMTKLQPPACLGRRPKNIEESIELRRYNVNDSMVTYKFVDLMRQFCTQHNMKLKMTIGSIGMDYWRRNHQIGSLVREHDDICKLHFLGSFKGGLTQVLKRGFIDKELHYYDYRSSYPARMRDGVDCKGSYPDVNSSRYLDKMTTEKLMQYEGITHAKVKAPYQYFPYLSYRHDKNGKLINPVGEFESWWTNYELRRAMKQGYDVTCFDGIIYEQTFTPFRDAVLYLYDLRKKYKEDNHPFQAMVKTLMNSGLFGKWGINFMEMEDLIAAEKISYDEKGYAYFEGEKITEYIPSEIADVMSGAFVVRKRSSDPFAYSIPILSSYTTMLGRSKLWDDTHDHAKYLVYMDTDSAIMTENRLVPGNHLGDWEKEYECEWGLFVKPKLYMIKPKLKDAIVRTKGIGRSSVYDSESFYDLLEKRMTHIQRFTRMKESNVMGIASGTIIAGAKRIDLEDNKRLWNRPFQVQEIQDSEPICL